MRFVSGCYRCANKRSGVPVQQPINEQQGFVAATLHKQLTKNCQASIKAIEADFATAERQIEELIQQDERLKQLFEWIISVPGVGPATAIEVFVATDEFKAIADPEKLAASAGRLSRGRTAAAVSPS